jgi:hypothetical protein
MSTASKTKDNHDEAIHNIYNFSEPLESTRKRGFKVAKKHLTPSRESIDKTTRWSTLFLAVFVLFFSISYVKTSIAKPFIREKKNIPNLDLLALGGQDAGVFGADNSLLGVDTDEDGLSDYDEVNTFFTSPFLEDSDSDGISDFDEIQEGTDPVEIGITVPDQTQDGALPFGTQPSLNSNQFNSGQLDELLQLYNSLPDNDSQSLVNLFEAQNTGAFDVGSLSPSDLRTLLLQQGVSNELLTKVSDDELQELVADTLRTLENQ